MRKTAILLVLLLLAGIQVVLAQKTITGKVTSSEDGLGIPGATVLVKGTTTGVITDMSGAFRLSMPANSTTLVISVIGMKALEVPIGTQTSFAVVLEPEARNIEGVVITALGISRDKKSLGYAVQEVKKDVIERTGNSDLAGAMQGKLAGIDIKPSSGMPGASSQIVIRGSRSFTGNNTPLYVIDGMPVSSTADFSTGNSVTGADVSNRAVDINPSDIESINILKGQAAAALYGIRASNGVVIITTKSGKGNVIGKPIVAISHTSSFSQVSRKPDLQSTYAEGTYGVYKPVNSFSWGPKIVDLPNDPTYGGNLFGQPGKYRVTQLEQGKVADVWMTPQVYNNWDDYFQTGYSASTNVNVSQASESGNFALGISETAQKGIAPSTGMNRWNAKAAVERTLNKNFKAGFSSNYSKTVIDKLPSANDAALAGVYSAPASYNLKGYPSFVPGDPYKQIYYRSLTFDNPYWAAEHNVFNEKTDRFFGNGYIDYLATLSDNMKLKVRYQLGMDSYTTHYQDIFEFGHANKPGYMDNYGVSSATVNSLLTANFDWKLSENFNFNALVGNEFTQGSTKTYSEHGEGFNFGGWAHIQNANTVTASESQSKDRTVGAFASLSLDWKSMIYLNATGRNDIVSSMPRGNRSFFYPSASLGFVVSELEALKDNKVVSFAKVRFSYAEVGQAGSYYKNFFTKPGYGGGFWSGVPISYPIGGINAYIPNNTQYDPKLKPQNTKSYELGADLKFFNNRFGIDYTFSRQNVVDQIFTVPLAGSTGAGALLMNGGKVHTVSHEVVLYISPVATKDFKWDINVNYSKIDNIVDVLAPGVESIFLGGFVTPQVRAGIGSSYPVIYGVSFVRDANNNIVVEDNPGAWNNGMPKIGEPGVIGKVSPNFILAGTNTFTYRNWSMSATAEWKSGGKMYSGSNGLLDLYGMSKRTEDRTSTFVFDGVKPDGTKNDIARGGPSDPKALQDLYTNVLSNIDEYYIHDNSFVKLRELSLKFKPAKKIFKTSNLGVSVFARNLLLWSALENFDPESSQGNNNMGGSFERFSMPQTSSVGFSFDLTF